MARWNYKATNHKFPEVTAEPKHVIECDTKGNCLVHDFRERNMNALVKILDEEGRQGWELIQCSYHTGELLCLWKKEGEEA